MDLPPVLFVGVITHDVIALAERFPGPDERVLATDIVRAGGGPAATAAVAAARLGVPAALAGTVGDDDESRTVLADLAAEGVDTSRVVSVAGSATASSVVIVDEDRATRAIVHRPGPPLALDASSSPIDQFDWIHVDHAGWDAIHENWRTASARPKLSIDAGNPIAGFTPDGIDLYVPTVAALRRRYGDDDPAGLLTRALDEGARTVVATDGADGTWALGAEQPLVHVPAVDGPVRSTLGAGDVFHGALLAGIVSGHALLDAIVLATRVSYASCRGIDGRSAIPTLAELDAIPNPGGMP